MNSSAFDSAKNLIDRQLATTKSPAFSAAHIQEGVQIYRRFVECFYADDSTVFNVESAYSWLADATASNVSAIAASNPLGELAATLQSDAEFKTQTKAKAQPGFAATLPYGQSIIATQKIMNARFAGCQPGMYLNLKNLLRTGVILDYGMSDDELSNNLLKLGVAHLMNGESNFQADVSRQDSSHTMALLLAFTLIMRDTGASEEDANFYLEYCRLYVIKSRGADNIRAAISANLGSGDPFTLIRNCVMMLCVIACLYADAKTMILVQKGDDLHGILESFRRYYLDQLPSIRNVKLTTDIGAAGYHAGRFHNGTRYLVDPVRAFYKHFTRLSAEQNSEAELYNSFISRATNYSDDEVDFLIAACQNHYPYLSGSTVHMMINTIVSMRNRPTFSKYCKLKLKTHYIAVDTQKDCVVQCLRILRPKWPKWKLAQFRNLDSVELREKLDEAGIAYKYSNGYHPIVPPGVISLTPTHAKVVVPCHDL